jgi:hypothetical protein
MQNRQDFNQMAKDARWIDVTGAMRNMVRGLDRLAPDPRKKGQAGAISLKSAHRAAACVDNRDSMLATLMIDAFFGGVINSALTEGLGLPDWAGNIDIANTIDAYDEYWTDRQESRGNNRTDGGYELGGKKAISGGFNNLTRPMMAGRSTEWDLYMRDMPSRRVLEQNLSGLGRKLDSIQGEYRAKPAGMALGM